jgi:hypothetical protein
MLFEFVGMVFGNTHCVGALGCYIVARGLASIHFEKYSTATTTYFKFSCAGGSGPNKSRPHLCNGQVGWIN